METTSKSSRNSRLHRRPPHLLFPISTRRSIPAFVLASDNAYLYRSLETHTASATFTDDVHAANVKNQERMIQMAGSIDRLIPSHDGVPFQKYSPQGRVGTLKPAK